MSRWRTKPVHFRCLNDCRQEGCPEHDMVLEYCRSSDTVAILIDGDLRACFDDNEITALKESLVKREGE